MDGSDWYYSNEGQQLGPVLFRVLERLVDRGLGPEDLIWREGWGDWIPASQVNGLKERFEASEQPVELNDDQAPVNVPTSPAHFFDHFLNALRALFPQADLDGIGEIMVVFGRYSLYVAMLLWLVFSTIRGITIDSLDWVLYGVGGVLIALALQYSAVRLTLAMPRLIQSTPTRMSTTAFLDSFAVIMLVGGVIGLATLTLLAIRQGHPNYIFIGVGIFFVCEQLALLSLNPDALNIKITEDASTGEEAIGIISFVMMLFLRLVPGVFGIGTTVGTVGMFACCLFYLKGGEHVVTALCYAPIVVGVVVFCTLFPVIIYLDFVFNYLIVDVIRSILTLPGKLDHLSDQQRTPQPRRKGEPQDRRSSA